MWIRSSFTMVILSISENSSSKWVYIATTASNDPAMSSNSTAFRRPLLTSRDIAVRIDLVNSSPIPCNPCLNATAKASGASARTSTVATA
eukprot:Gb_07787 [translate_table: standard]